MTDLAQRESPFVFKVSQRDLMAELLADKRSPNTRRAYAKDLKDFFICVAEQEPNPQLVGEFLKLERATAIGLVLQYKAALIDRGLAEATVNRRLAAVKSLCMYAQKVGKCEWSLEEIQGERVKAYRDTTGVSKEVYQRVLESCDRTTLTGRRDYAILRLLWDNVLRRGEVNLLNVADFDPDTRSLQILGKGKGTQKEAVSLSVKTGEAIANWLEAWGQSRPAGPLFVALDRAHRGHRLSGSGIYEIVRSRAEQVGIKKRLSPHRCRHSGITAALDATNGNVREVKKLSRHAKVETLLVYDDNRANAQGALSELLSEMV